MTKDYLLKSLKIALSPIVLLCAMAIFPAQANAKLVINELMQSNIDCIMDDLNEFPDSWVELYNTGPESVNLTDYSIGISMNKEKAYHLPARIMKAGEYIVVYCDKVASGLHTSFRLESGNNGEVYLFKGGEIEDCVIKMKKQPAPNIAFGRTTDGASSWGYQLTPTPGEANCGETSNNILGSPVFSQPGRVSQSRFSLKLTLPEGTPEGTEIRYTINGKEPTESSTLYTSPIFIYKTTVVRATLFNKDYLSPRSTVHSYIFLGTSHKMTLPVVSIVTDNSYFYNNDIGIYIDKNNGSTRHDWRRPINLEMFCEEDAEGVINQLCETRVKGGATRSAPLKSLALYANKRFGTKRFDYEFFPEDAAGITDWKSIEMRNAGNDFDYLYMRDAVIQRNAGRRIDLDWQPWQPSIVYINGQYKGILNIRPRSNEDYVYSFYNGLEDVDVVENWKDIKEGDEAHLAAFNEFYQSHDHTLAEFNEIMDTEEFCNLMIVQSFHNNLDFPGNNIMMWRPRADGGRWRWIIKDTDFGLGLYDRPYDYKYLDWLYNHDYDSSNNWANDWEHTRLFRRLMESQEFKDMFIDRSAVYMGDFLNGTVLADELEEMASVLRYEYKVFHRKLFNASWPDYEQELTKAKTWAENRTSFFYSYLSDFFGLGDAVPVTIDKDREDGVRITVNDVPLSGRSFDGKFFKNRVMRLSGKCTNNSIKIVGWNVNVTGVSGAGRRITGDSARYIIPAGARSVEISTIVENNTDIDTGIDTVTGDENTDSRDIYTVEGIKVKDMARPGIYIQKGKKILVK